jgi:hypothetical protein
MDTETGPYTGKHAEKQVSRRPGDGWLVQYVHLRERVGPTLSLGRDPLENGLASGPATGVYGGPSFRASRDAAPLKHPSADLPAGGAGLGPAAEGDAEAIPGDAGS